MSRVDLHFDQRWWIPVDLDADPADWVPDVVRDRWDAEGLPAGGDRLRGVQDALTRVVEAVVAADPPVFLALLLHPRADDGVAAVAALRVEEADGPVTRQDALEALLLPREMLEEPADIRDVQTRGGTAVRVRQRYRSPRDADVETVSESLAYLWFATDDDGDPVVLTFSTSIEDLVTAHEVGALFDEVAVTVAVVED